MLQEENDMKKWMMLAAAILVVLGIGFAVKGSSDRKPTVQPSETALPEAPAEPEQAALTDETQTEDVMADTMPCIGPETAVVSLQNGLGNDEVLAQFVDADRILYGSGLIGTELAGPGVCVSKPEKGIQMHFGAVRNNPKANAAGKALEACFRAGGCNASFDEDVRPYIWKKVIANSGYNGVSAVMRLKVKETFADPYGHDIVMHVWKEGCAVAQSLGIGDLWPLMEKEEPNIVANLGNYYPSMAQDAVLHQRQTEISVLNGAIARYGARLGVPTPFNTVITQVISCIQNNYDKQYLG